MVSSSDRDKLGSPMFEGKQGLIHVIAIRYPREHRTKSDQSDQQARHGYAEDAQLAEHGASDVIAAYHASAPAVLDVRRLCIQWAEGF